jgi:5-methylcytosine-specific restriction endonuclease McrA
MGNEISYSEKLKDPRWQKKRLEVMQRDNWCCCRCGDKSSPLNVHHANYNSEWEPWEYPDIWLITLCESCHEEETFYRKQVEGVVLMVLREKLFVNELNQLIKLIEKTDRKEFLNYINKEGT